MLAAGARWLYLNYQESSRVKQNKRVRADQSAAQALKQRSRLSRGAQDVPQASMIARQESAIRAQVKYAMIASSRCEQNVEQDFPDDSLIDKDIEFFNRPRDVISKVGIAFRKYLTSKDSALAKKMILDAITSSKSEQEGMLLVQKYKKFMQDIEPCFPTRIYSFLDTVIEVLGQKRYEPRYQRLLLMTVLTNLKGMLGSEQSMFVVSSMIMKLFSANVIPDDFKDEWDNVNDRLKEPPINSWATEVTLEQVELTQAYLADMDQELGVFIDSLVVYADAMDLE
jgi:hypothetical protein